MANRTPHVVGGGLGTFRQQAQANHAERAKAQQAADNKAAIARLAKSVSK